MGREEAAYLDPHHADFPNWTRFEKETSPNKKKYHGEHPHLQGRGLGTIDRLWHTY